MAHIDDDREYILKVLAERKKAKHAQLVEDEKLGQARAQGVHAAAQSLKESKEREREVATYGKNDYEMLLTVQTTLEGTLREPHDHNKRATPDFVMSILGKVAKYVAPKLEAMKDTTHNELVKIATEAEHRYHEMALNVWVEDGTANAATRALKTAKVDAATAELNDAIDVCDDHKDELAIAERRAAAARDNVAAVMATLPGRRAANYNARLLALTPAIEAANASAARAHEIEQNWITNVREDNAKVAALRAKLEQLEAEAKAVPMHFEPIKIGGAPAADDTISAPTASASAAPPSPVRGPESVALSAAAAPSRTAAAKTERATFKAAELRKIRDAEAMYKQLVDGIRRRELIL